MAVKVKVVADSSATMPAAVVADLDITLVPLWLHLGDRSYRDGVDLEAADFYQRLESGERATTSSPSPGDFLHAYEEAAADGYDQIFVGTVARGLSVIFDAARAAADEFAKIPVLVFDTGTAITGSGLVMMEAARAAAAGADLAAVKHAASEVAERVDLLGSLATLRHLRRSGRVNLAGFVAGETLKVKPIFRLRRGVIEREGIARSRQRSVDRIVEEVLAEVGVMHAGVFHAGEPGVAAEIESRLRVARPGGRVFVTSFSPALGAHTGPGVVGVAWFYS